MQSKFKAGDKVKVVEEHFPFLGEGEIHTVDYIDGDLFVHLIGNKSLQGWYQHRFELVEEPKPETPQIEFKYNGKVYQGVVKEGCKGCTFESDGIDCHRSNKASKEQTGNCCYTHGMIWVEKKPEQPKPKVNEQIIHCHSHSTGVHGSTWVFTESDKGQKYVDVQYVLCHPKDQYCKKTGVQLAKSKPKVTMMKGKVPDYVWVEVYSGYSSTNKCVNFPGIKQLYQAICHLIK